MVGAKLPEKRRLFVEMMIPGCFALTGASCITVKNFGGT